MTERGGITEQTGDHSADEGITGEDNEWWEIRGWKTRAGIRVYQAVRSVQHVLVNMLSTTIQYFVAPKGLSRMPVGGTHVWDEQEGMWL